MQLAQIDIQTTFFSHSPGARGVFDNVGSIISRVLPNIIVAAGLVFFILILGGGFMMIKNSGGNSSPQDAAKAKSAVTFALIGFLIVVGAYFILEIITAITGVDFISPVIP